MLYGMYKKVGVGGKKIPLLTMKLKYKSLKFQEIMRKMQTKIKLTL